MASCLSFYRCAALAPFQGRDGRRSPRQRWSAPRARARAGVLQLLTASDGLGRRTARMQPVETLSPVPGVHRCGLPSVGHRVLCHIRRLRSRGGAEVTPSARPRPSACDARKVRRVVHAKVEYLDTMRRPSRFVAACSRTRQQTARCPAVQRARKQTSKDVSPAPATTSAARSIESCRASSAGAAWHPGRTPGGPIASSWPPHSPSRGRRRARRFRGGPEN